jgi:hypothetical protein
MISIELLFTFSLIYSELLFAGSAIWASAVPLYLYTSRVFDISVRENASLFAFGIIAAAFALFNMYDTVSTQKRNHLIAER